jgi:hypothetical protein
MKWLTIIFLIIVIFSMQLVNAQIAQLSKESTTTIKWIKPVKWLPPIPMLARRQSINLVSNNNNIKTTLDRCNEDWSDCGQGNPDVLIINETKLKFGAEDTDVTENSNYRYTFNSDLEIKRDNIGFYYENIEDGLNNKEFSKKIRINVDDVCNKLIYKNITIFSWVNVTINNKKVYRMVIKKLAVKDYYPYCKLYQTDEYTMQMDFIGHYNTETNSIFIDPYYNIDESTFFSSSNYIDTIQAGISSHLNWTSNYPFNQTMLYVPMDVNQTYTYDYSPFNLLGTLTNIRWNQTCILGGCYQDYFNMGDIQFSYPLSWNCVGDASCGGLNQYNCESTTGCSWENQGCTGGTISCTGLGESWCTGIGCSPVGNCGEGTWDCNQYEDAESCNGDSNCNWNNGGCSNPSCEDQTSCETCTGSCSGGDENCCSQSSYCNGGSDDYTCCDSGYCEDSNCGDESSCTDCTGYCNDVNQDCCNGYCQDSACGDPVSCIYTCSSTWIDALDCNTEGGCTDCSGTWEKNGCCSNWNTIDCGTPEGCATCSHTWINATDCNLQGDCETCGGSWTGDGCCSTWGNMGCEGGSGDCSTETYPDCGNGNDNSCSGAEPNCCGSNNCGAQGGCENCGGSWNSIQHCTPSYDHCEGDSISCDSLGETWCSFMGCDWNEGGCIGSYGCSDKLVYGDCASAEGCTANLTKYDMYHTGWTFSFWVYPNATRTFPNTNDMVIIQRLGTMGEKGYSMRLHGNLAYFVEDTSGISRYTATPSYIKGNWTMITTTCDYASHQHKIYYNGKFYYNWTNDNCEIKPVSGNTYIGNNPSHTMYFEGKIDDVMILNRALNDTEINRTYMNQSTRFVSTGTQESNSVSVATGYIYVNVSIENYQRILGSNISMSVHWYNSTNDGYTAYQNISGNILSSNLFTIPNSTTSLKVIFKLIPDINLFYTPNLLATTGLNLHLYNTIPYTSSNWIIDCSDIYSITSNTNMNGNLTLKGTGTVYLTAHLSFNKTNLYIFKDPNCEFHIDLSTGGING